MTNGDTVDPRLFRRKPTYNEILDLIERDEDKVELPERIGVQFFDSFAMGQYKEMLQDAAAGTQAVAEHQQMDAAMTQAATQEEGVSRQELLGFMRDVNAQNTCNQIQLQPVRLCQRQQSLKKYIHIITNIKRVYNHLFHKQREQIHSLCN